MSLLSSAINAVLTVVGLVKDKAKFTEIAMELIAKLPQVILYRIQFNKIDSVGKLEEALAELDLRTVIDLGALDIIRHLPPDKEEILCWYLTTTAD